MILKTSLMLIFSGGSSSKTTTVGFVSIPIKVDMAALEEPCCIELAKESRIYFSMPFFVNIKLSNCTEKMRGLFEESS